MFNKNTEIQNDWSDYGLWWPEKCVWLSRSRSTLDQYGVHASAELWFTPMHKKLRILMPDLQTMEYRVNFSVSVFKVVVKLCKEIGKMLLTKNFCNKFVMKSLVNF